MENSDRIQINGVWYVREENTIQILREVRTVNWMINKLQELVEQGYGDIELTMMEDYGDYTTITDVEPVRDWDGGTTDFDSVCFGSNPDRSTKKFFSMERKKFLKSFIFSPKCFIFVYNKKRKT
jgi:hypothetical protein